jgi:hypothetical protein
MGGGHQVTIDYSDPWTIGWIIWLVLFLIWEGIALFNSKPGDTLSEHVWIWFGTRRSANMLGKKRTGWVQFRRFVLVAFMAWISLHFLTGGWV